MKKAKKIFKPDKLPNRAISIFSRLVTFFSCCKDKRFNFPRTYVLAPSTDRSTDLENSDQLSTKSKLNVGNNSAINGSERVGIIELIEARMLVIIGFIRSSWACIV